MALTEIQPAVNQHRDGLDIIYIRGITIPGGDRESEKWKTTIPDIVPPNSSLWEFDLKTELGDTFNVELFMRKSTELLNDLFKLHQRIKKNCRPLVFFCYSLGGMVLKKALWNARQRITEFSELIESISGIVFLATPHFTERGEPTSRALAHILRLSSTDAAHPSDFGALPIFTTACQQFDELRMQIPILSCYESRRTTLQQSSWSLWRWHHSEILVDEKLSKTSAPFERLEVIDTDLHLIFDKTNSALQHEIFRHLKEIAEQAPERLRANSMFLREVYGLNPSSDHSLNKNGLPQWSTDPQASNTVIPPSRENSMKKSDTTNSQMPTTPQSLSKSMDSTAGFHFIPNDASKILAPQCAVKLPCYFTGPYTGPNPHFQGRSDTLQTIDKVFHCAPGVLAVAPISVVIFMVCGLGGVGKTQVAVSYMFSRKECFQAVFWLQADQSGKLDDAFKKIATQLGLEVSDDAIVNKERVHTWLSRPNISEELHGNQKEGPKLKEASWLMIFDNAEDPALLKDYFPLNGHGYVLITKRDPTTNPTYPQFAQKSVVLKSLEVSEAVSLFRELVDTNDRQHPPNLIDDSVQRLHYFPLSIVHMAGIINCRKLSLSEFLEEYDKLDKRTELHSSNDSMDTSSEHGYSKTLSTLWSIESLPISCSRLLCAMALLDPDCIQVEIFLKRLDEVEFEGFPPSRDEYNSALAQLTQMAIVSQRPGHGNQLKIHPVVQELVQEELGGRRPVLNEAFVAVTGMLCSMWPFALLQKDGAYQKYGRKDRWEQCKMLLPHVESLRKVFRSFQQQEDGRPLATKKLGWLVVEAAVYCHETGSFPQAKEHLESALEIQKLCSGNKTELKELLSAIHNVWGTLATATNAKELAIFHQERCKEIEEELFNESGRYTSRLAVACSDLGRAKIANCSFEGVMDLFERSMKIRENLPNFDELQLYNPLRGMAMVHYYYGLQGDKQDEFCTSKAYLEKALAVREARFGENDTEGGRTGSLLYELGNVHKALGQFPPSFDYHLRAYNQWSSTVGDFHRNTATACYKVACHYFDMGKMVDALKYLERARAVFEKGSLQQPELARTLYKISQCYLSQRMHEKANHTINEAWRIRNQFLGGDPLPLNELKEAHFDDCVEYWSR